VWPCKSISCFAALFASNTSKIWCTFSLTNRYFAKGYSFDGILTIIFIVPLGVYFSRGIPNCNSKKAEFLISIPKAEFDMAQSRRLLLPFLSGLAGLSQTCLAVLINNREHSAMQNLKCLRFYECFSDFTG